MERSRKAKALLQDGNKSIGCHRDPDLSLDRAFTMAMKCLDPRMLLDLLEEEFDLRNSSTRDPAGISRRNAS